MKLRVLGTVEFFGENGQKIALAPQAARFLALLAASDAPVNKALIGEHVTGTDPDASAVRTAVSRLRASIGPHLARSERGYTLDIDANETDAGRFRELLRNASLSSGRARATALGEALELWSGDRPFGHSGDEHWALAQSVELTALRAAAIEDLADALLTLGDPAGAIALLRPHIIAHVLDERPVALLMRALAANGKLAEALRELHRLSRSLAEVGLEPSGDIRRLEHNLLRQHETSTGLNEGQPPQPTGHIAIVFTSIVDSTRLWATRAEAMSDSLKLHDQIVEQVLADHQAYVFTRLGDGVGAAFHECDDAIRACLALQSELNAVDWPGPPLAIRLGISTGNPETRDRHYVGEPINRASLLTAAANGGQILTSSDVRNEAAFDGIDLGEHHLRGIDVPDRIWQVGTMQHPPLQTPSVVPVRLPQNRHPLIGRDSAVDSLSALLQQNRLVTLTGAGGCGKTVLAITVARQSAQAFPGGVYFVDLAPIEIGSEVAVQFARSIGAPPSSPNIDRILGSLPTGDALLVVDNCEHVLGEVEAIIDQIVDRHGQVTVLATSREALQVAGEYTFRVASLDTAPDGAAAQLFHDRALAVRPDANLNDRNAIADLCERLDGMPLAIEMAAARVRSMSLDEIGRRLDDRFRLLSGGTRRARRRQQTLELVITWSHDLLTVAEQRFFRRLAVFSGGFFADAAAAVCDVDGPAAIDLLDALVGKSMVDTVDAGEDTRFRLLESIRVFGIDRLVELDDPDAARRRHATHYASRWDDPQITAAHHRRHLVDEHNMIAAIDWAREQADTPLTLAKLISLGGPIGAFVERRWNERGTSELVRQIIAVARSEPLRNTPELLVPFVAAACVGSFAAFTDDAELRSAVIDLDELAAETVDLMKHPTFRSPSPSCGLLLVHRAHHLLPHRADEAHQWAHGFTDNTNYAIKAMATMAAEMSLTFLDPTDSSIDPLRVVGDDTPEGPWTNAIAANAAYLSIVTGRLEQAVQLLELAGQNTTPGSMSDLNRLAGLVATSLSLGQVGDAMTLFIDQIDDVPFGVPGRESTYLALCAWARHIRGDTSRAEHLIDQTVKRLPQDYLLTCHIKAIISGWPIDEFHKQSVAWHDDHSTGGDLVRRIAAMPGLLAQEVSFWKGRSLR